MSEEKRLVRSSTDKMLCGVCGGLADYFDVDPVLVRLVFVALAMVDGIGVLLYIVLCIVLPETSTATAMSGNGSSARKDVSPTDGFEPLGTRQN